MRIKVGSNKTSISILLGALVSAAPVLAGGPLLPSAIRSGANTSFLMNYQLGAHPESVQNDILENKKSLELRQEYEDMVRNYEARSKFGLNSLEEDRAHDADVKGFSARVIETVKNYQFKLNLKKMKSVADKDPILSKLKRPATLAAAVAAAYYGAPVKLKVSDVTEIAAKAHVPSKRAQLSVNSPLVDSYLDYSPTTPAAARNQSDERYRLAVSKGIPGIDVNSVLSYGSTTTALTASLSKRLIRNLSMAVDSSMYMTPDRMDNRPGQETVRFLYDLRF